MARLGALLIAAAAMTPLAAQTHAQTHAQARTQAYTQGHTKDDEAACRPDVFRLCAWAIPNQRRIVACLTQNKRYLSNACYRVFDRDQTTNPAAAMPVRNEPPPAPWGR